MTFRRPFFARLLIKTNNLITFILMKFFDIYVFWFFFSSFTCLKRYPAERLHLF